MILPKAESPLERYAAKVVDVECAFVLEGRDEEELPEQVRYSRNEPAPKLQNVANCANFTKSMPT